MLPITTTGAKKSLTSLLRVEQLTLAELIQFRMLIEGSANELAASLRTDEQLADMDEAMRQMKSAIGEDYAEFSRADLAFHDAVAEAAGNRLLQIANDVVRGVVLNLVSNKIEHADNRVALMQDSVRRHRLVLEAIRDRAGDRAAALARKHLYEYYAVFLSPTERQRVEALHEPPTVPVG